MLSPVILYILKYRKKLLTCTSAGLEAGSPDPAEQDKIKKNLKKYSDQFNVKDRMRLSRASKELVSVVFFTFFFCKAV